MPLTVLEINAAKPGLRPVKQSANGEKEQKGKKNGKKDKQVPSKDKVSVEGGDPTGNEDSGFVKTDKPYKMADGGGLYLEVDPSGGKHWRFKYRFPKEKRISLGVYPDVGLADARKERDKCREQLADQSIPKPVLESLRRSFGDAIRTLSGLRAGFLPNPLCFSVPIRSLDFAFPLAVRHDPLSYRLDKSVQRPSA